MGMPKSGQLENVRLMLTTYPAHSEFRTLVAAGGRAGRGERYVRLRCSVNNPDKLRLMVETLVQWGHQHAVHVWLDDTLKEWIAVPPATR